MAARRPKKPAPTAAPAPAPDEDEAPEVEIDEPADGAAEPGDVAAAAEPSDAAADDEEDETPGGRALVSFDPLQRYLTEIRRYPLLSREEETALAKQYLESGDIDAAYKLVTGNLRLVVMIAREYQRATRNLLDLIQHEHRTRFAGGLEPRGLPLLTNPVGAAQRRLVCADVAHGDTEFTGDLLDESRLSNLARACDDLHEPPRLDEPLGENGTLRALEVSLSFTHYIEYFYSAS